MASIYPVNMICVEFWSFWSPPRLVDLFWALVDPFGALCFGDVSSLYGDFAATCKQGRWAFQNPSEII